MAKKVKSLVKLQIPAGKANPAPPVGPALGQAGVNIQEFCTKFNEATKDQMGNVVPVVITVYDDRTFDFVTKTPPASDQLKKAAGLKKGGKLGNKEIIGTVTMDQIRAIAENKLKDLNANDVDAASNIIMGTAKSMGLKVEN